uniref:(northern house mosquito) hypothetical protein n=1 Tax=Culex pipiens TaxID=7175 RepID=A0A8D8IR65_CULPI
MRLAEFCRLVDSDSISGTQKLVSLSETAQPTFSVFRTDRFSEEEELKSSSTLASFSAIFRLVFSASLALVSVRTCSSVSSDLSWLRMSLLARMRFRVAWT